MNTHHPSEEEIFDHLRQLSTPEERAAYLQNACAGNEQLRQNVESLLQAHEQAGPFLQQPPAALSDKTFVLSAESIPVTEKPGDRIGRYKLLQQIGEGGCGVVYMAEQEEPVRRRVALKVIKLGMDTKSVIARFEAERQALALMDHPHIAKVLDAGATDTGRPFFVMELVRGIRITDYCDQNNLSTAQRLDLFIQVCQAIQHAHQKGIIHRDIKPSNILVADHDGVPVPKVIDFGIAKATTDQRLTDKTLFTAFEQFIGTPAYMSPEQAKLSGLDIDTRSDIYSLGVLLYELLTGRTPFDATTLLKAGLDQMRRIIREQEPQRPSTLLSTLDTADLTAVSNCRRAEPLKLVNLIRGDLDWIVMRALEKDRTRRFETANAFALDVQRHLDDEPVVARPPSQLYRLQKFIQRNKVAIVSYAAMTVAILFGVGVVISLLHEKEQARQRAMAAEIAQNRMRQEVEMHQLEQEAGNLLNTQVNNLPKAEDLSRQALAIRRKLSGNENFDTASALGNLAAVLVKQYSVADVVLWDKLAEAESLYREALSIRRKLFTQDNVIIAESLEGLGLTFYDQNKLVEAESCYREALTIRRKLNGDDWSIPEKLGVLADDLEWQKKFAEAEPLYREALALREKRGGRPGVTSLQNLAKVLYRQNRFAEAESLYREALAERRKMFGNAHLDVASSLRIMASVLRAQNKPVEAEVAHRDALEIEQRQLMDANPEIIEHPGSVKADFPGENSYEEAEQAFSELVDCRNGGQHLHIGLLRERAKFYASHARWKEAAADFTKVIEETREEPLASNSEDWLCLLPALIESGDLAGYQQYRTAMLDRIRPLWEAERNFLEPVRMLQESYLMPSAVEKLALATYWSNKFSDGADTEPRFDATKAAGFYRQGRFSEVVPCAKRALGKPGVDQGRGRREEMEYAILGMAYQQLGQTNEARSALAKGIEIAEEKQREMKNYYTDNESDLGSNWYEWLSAHILMREAWTLIEKVRTMPESIK